MVIHRASWGMFTLLLLTSFQVSLGAGGSISNEPTLKTDKPKIQMLQSFSTAYERNPDDDDNKNEIEPRLGRCSVGELDNGKCKVHPLAVAYLERDRMDKGFDVHAAVSLDEGGTWKRMNLSKNADKQRPYKGPCFTAHSEDDGDSHHADGRLLQDENQVEFMFFGNNVKPMIVAKGNKILVAWTSQYCKGGIPGNQDGNDETDPQNTLAETGDDDKYLVRGRQMCTNYEGLNGLTEEPYKCVWAARGEVTENGDISWSKSERLTSGRRDAMQLVAAVAGNQAAWALAWQEDPRGLRIGDAEGPGDGMSGATVNHKTDIWYSYLPKSFFGKWDHNSPDSNRGDIQDSARFTTPVRITDNAACKAEKNADGTLAKKGAPYCAVLCKDDDYEDLPVYSDKQLLTCVLKKENGERIPLDGNTGASRVNMFLIPVGSGARVVMAYEESKGLGKGPGGHEGEDTTQEPAEREDWGKNIYFHSFIYDNPQLIDHGTMINLPELGPTNQPTITEDESTFYTLNARRVRMIIQPESQWGPSKVSMVLLYREGEEGHGHPAHIVMRRFVGGFEPQHMECKNRHRHPKTKQLICTRGSTDLNEDNRTPDPEGTPDARAHRGFLRGDFLVVGYTYTENWGRGHVPKYDFFVRRSFDGGRKWTNASGQKEGPRNLSNIQEEDNPGWSVMEPRLYATPGSLKSPLSTDDTQNSAVFYAAYSTTHHQSNDPKDLYWTMTDNFGESYKKQWNDNAQKWEYPWFNKVSPAVQGGYAGVQIRTNPGGTKLFASYQGDIGGGFPSGGPCRGNGAGSDVCYNSTVTADPLLERFDLNGDGVVNSADANLLSGQYGHYDPKYDVNGDGMLNGLDLQVWRLGEAEFAKRGIRRHLRVRE